MSVLDLFQAVESTRLALLIKESTWAFASIESVHLLALAMMGGSVLLVDFRLLGLGLTARPVRELAQEMRGWMTASLVVLVVTGIGLFLSESVKCYYSTPFWVKMGTLVVATLYAYGVRGRAIARMDHEVAASGRVLALVSMALWFVVAASGRWIGFSG